MELKEAIKTRRSVRSFTNDEVKTSEVKEILQLAGYAPSINNSQPWEFILIKDKKILTAMADEVKNALSKIEKNDSAESEQILKKVEWYSTFFKDVPALIVVVQKNYTTVLENVVKLSQKEINELRNFPDIQSFGALIQNILLAALDFGYATCWLSAPSIASENIQKILSVTNDKKVLSFVAIGKPLAIPPATEKNDINTILKVIE